MSLNNNLGALTFVLGSFPFDIQPYRSMPDNLNIILALPSANTFR